jgi:hypothetical protein
MKYKYIYVILLCLLFFYIGWLSNRNLCNVKAFYIGYDSGYYDGVMTSQVSEVVIESGDLNEF